METDELRDKLAAMGYIQFQGYLVSRPFPEQEFLLSWLALSTTQPTSPSQQR